MSPVTPPSSTPSYPSLLSGAFFSYVRGAKHPRGVGALLVGLLVSVAALVTVAAPASAHATLQSSSPPANQVLARPPAEVTLTFDEPVEPTPEGVRVLRTDGTNAANGPVAKREGGKVLAIPLDTDNTGTLTVTWRAVSQDGHPISGSYVFHIGEATGVAPTTTGTNRVVTVMGAVSRWMAYAGGIIGFGIATFVLLVERATRIDARRAHRLMLLCGAAAVAGTLGTGITRLADATGSSIWSSFGRLNLLVTTRYGQLDLVWMVAAAAFLVCAGLPPLRRHAIATVYAGIGLLGIPAFAGHAWTTSPKAIGVAADLLHTLSVGVWVGGLAALLIAVADEDDPTPFVARFSGVALPAAGLTVLTGLISSVLEVRSMSNLFGTAYGRLLIAKVSLVVIILLLGYLNRSRLVGIVDRTVAVLRNVRIELTMGMLVLALTAILGTQPPPRDAGSEPISGTVTASLPGGRVDLEVTRTPVPTKELHITFTGDDGRPLDMDAVEIQVSSAEVAPRKVPLMTLTPSHYVATDVVMTPAGTWQVQITAVRSGEPSTTTLEIQIK
ncbi:MAG: copper resistance protein CopC [Acidimicrobiales bacterium]|nr:copper resistance protein CopC [Acidimicrobiales bacterium]